MSAQVELRAVMDSPISRRSIISRDAELDARRRLAMPRRAEVWLGCELIRNIIREKARTSWS